MVLTPQYKNALDSTFHAAFDAELLALAEDLQDELLAHARLLSEFGPDLGRPTVDGLKGSKHPI